MACTTLDGTPEAQLLAITSIAMAANNLYERYAPLFVASIIHEGGRSGLLTTVTGYDTIEEMIDKMPDLKPLVEAFERSKATGETVTVHLPNSGVDVGVNGEPTR